MSSKIQVSAQEKLEQIAKHLSDHKLDAYYVSPEDEHLNEYLPENKKRIEWLTGFSGESAPLLVTKEKLHLYVDGRFHIQVDDEVDGKVVDAYKLGPDESGDGCIKKQLALMSKKCAIKVGYDPFTASPNRLKKLENALGKSHIQWTPVKGNLIDAIWQDKPEAPSKPAFIVEPEITGRSIEDKLKWLREIISKAGAEFIPITRLDDIGWLFNIRAGDIPYNPVLEAYALVGTKSGWLFADLSKIPDSVEKELSTLGIQLVAYENYAQKLAEILDEAKKPLVWLDKDAVTTGTLSVVSAHAKVLEKESPITLEKAIKNKTEIERMRLANFKASRAIIRHLAWVEETFAAGTKLSEEDVRKDLETKYQEESEFYDLSFPTIPGIGTNSAIIHYSHADPNNIGKEGDFYLLDSGCQYLGGTTDTTRTTVFGKPKPDQIARYTAVLKSHIACASLRFPEGTKGMQIDAVCREPLWKEGLDFAHGTGHGVGAFLNVHEGPNRISRVGGVVFLPGMITSIEPGYYLKDWGGIRLENLYVVQEDTQKEAFLGKKWLIFDSLTLAPFEKKLIDASKLSQTEKAWLNDYYANILNQIGPTLSPKEKAWLENQCKL